MKILIGIIIGIFISTVGVSGAVRVLERGVDVVKDQSRQIAK